MNTATSVFAPVHPMNMNIGNSVVAPVHPTNMNIATSVVAPVHPTNINIATSVFAPVYPTNINIGTSVAGPVDQNSTIMQRDIDTLNMTIATYDSQLATHNKTKDYNTASRTTNQNKLDQENNKTRLLRIPYLINLYTNNRDKYDLDNVLLQIVINGVTSQRSGDIEKRDGLIQEQQRISGTKVQNRNSRPLVG